MQHLELFMEQHVIYRYVPIRFLQPITYQYISTITDMASYAVYNPDIPLVYMPLMPTSAVVPLVIAIVASVLPPIFSLLYRLSTNYICGVSSALYDRM